MKPILVAYGTTEGHTRKIAEFIAQRLRAAGREAHLVDTATAAAAQVAPTYAGAILGGSLHQHRHQSSLTHFIRANAGWLNAIPVAFFSVSLSAASSDPAEHDEVRRLAEDYLAETGLKAGMLRLVAGALMYTQYDYFKRLLMKMIARREGGATDTSRDHEYTDWDDVARFVDAFLAATQGAGQAA